VSRFDASVTFSIEARFGTLPSATGGSWTSIDTYAKTVDISRGRSALFSEFDAGAAVITLDNRDGRFDPNNTGSPYDPNVKVSTPIRIKAVHSATTYHLYRGIAESWDVTYPEMGKDSVVTLSCVDESKALQSLDAGSTYASQLADARIGTVLNAVGWNSSRRTLETGLVTIAAGTVAVGTPALSHMRDVAQCDFGTVFLSANGNVTYHTRTHFSGVTTPQAVFGGGSTELPFVDIVPVYNDDYLWNEAKITRSTTGTAVTQESEDTGSIDSNWRRTFPFTGPFSNDNEALNLAEWMVDVYANITPRLESLTVVPRSDTDLWPQVLDLDLRDLVRVKHNPIGSGSNFNEVVSVEGISHVFTPGKEWVTSYTLGPLSTRETMGYWQVGSTDDLGTGTVLA
jgi:hypothetical protein